jgi:hypothetical protein
MLWLSVRESLKGPFALDYFDNAMRGGRIPPLRGLVLSSSSKVLVVTLSGGDAPEATLTLDKPLKRAIPTGKAVMFSGVAISFTQSPFMLGFDVKIRDISVVSWIPPKKVDVPFKE